MEGQFSLYKIHAEVINLIESQVDPATGELPKIAAAHLNTLSIRRADAIHQISLFHLENKAKAEAVEGEIKRLQLIKNSFEIRESFAKKIIERELADGETFEFENAKISYRKSEVVEVGDDLDLSQLAFDQPELIDISYSLKKAEIKKLAKDNKPIPEGITIVKKNNLVIK